MACKTLTHHYNHHWLKLKIVGFIEEDEVYETYHAQSKNPKRDVILHLLKGTNGRRFDVKDAKQFTMTAQKPSGIRKTQILPWVGDGEKDKEIANTR